jgi:hypothetical protein
MCSILFSGDWLDFYAGVYSVCIFALVTHIFPPWFLLMYFVYHSQKENVCFVYHIFFSCLSYLMHDYECLFLHMLIWSSWSSFMYIYFSLDDFQESLKYRLLGSEGDIGSWGHEYVRWDLHTENTLHILQDKVEHALLGLLMMIKAWFMCCCDCVFFFIFPELEILSFLNP